jgi:hypothetical protein
VNIVNLQKIEGRVTKKYLQNNVDMDSINSYKSGLLLIFLKSCNKVSARTRLYVYESGVAEQQETVI